jgi:proteasome lid subunit RPN8/RPN11
MKVLVPAPVLASAVRHAQLNPGLEVGGMFTALLDPALGVASDVRYILGHNVAEHPASNVELDPAWIYDNTSAVDRDVLAFFHSHPRGQAEPSEADMRTFPHWYVSKALIYFGRDDRLSIYDKDDWDIVGILNGIEL